MPFICWATTRNYWSLAHVFDIGSGQYGVIGRSAVSEREYNQVQELLEAGVDPTATDDKQRAPIHFAVTKGDHSILQLLLDHQVRVHIPTFQHSTPKITVFYRMSS